MVKKLTIYNALEPFLNRPIEEIHLADISRELKQPHPTVRLWLNTLEKQGILKKNYKGRLTLYSLNFESPNIIDYIVIAEKNKLMRYSEKTPILAEFVRFIQNEIKGDCLIFGSATENFRNAQDIDLLIIGDKTKNIKKFARRLNKELHIIDVSSLDKISKSLKTEITKKHLLIKGSENFVRWILWQQ